MREALTALPTPPAGEGREKKCPRKPSLSSSANKCKEGGDCIIVSGLSFIAHNDNNHNMNNNNANNENYNINNSAKNANKNHTSNNNTDDNDNANNDNNSNERGAEREENTDAAGESEIIDELDCKGCKGDKQRTNPPLGNSPNETISFKALRYMEFIFVRRNVVPSI